MSCRPLAILEGDEVWREGPRPFWPNAVWRVPVGNEGCNILDLHKASPNDTNFTHMRRLTPHRAAVIAADPDERLREAWLLIRASSWDPQGERRPRDEDENYVPIGDVLRSADWSAGSTMERMSDLRYEATVGLGWTHRRIGDIADVREVRDVPADAPEAEASRTIWIGVSQAVVWPSRQPATGSSEPCLRLDCTGVDEAEFLWRILHDTSTRVRLAAIAQSTPGRQAMLRHMVADLPVPWPAGHQMPDLLGSLRFAAENLSPYEFDEPADSHEGWPSWNELNRLRESLQAFSAWADDESASPIRFMRLRNDLSRSWSQVTEKMEAILGAGTWADADALPAPLAETRAQAERDPEADHRIKLAFDLLELALAFDAVARLACLEALTPGASAGVFAKQPRRGDAWGSTTGLWKELRDAATKQLKTAKAQADDHVLWKAKFYFEYEIGNAQTRQTSAGSRPPRRGQVR